MMYGLLGLVAGVAAGFFGIGGGIILVPALIWFFNMPQHQAQGVSLAALVLPVGILGALQYYRAEPFPLKIPLWIALGLALGAYAGGYLAQLQSEKTLRIAFGILTIAAGVKIILGR